ncbi:hypothetical protein SODALDRAFT_377769 [Sodiomyces alkalinus F11]|uniref:Uncharacterized protein n=1 Tax=Sodiomyces alkalinus (strain CBS 110278 / VKM F-3762 / F11) TaxID=1314773 RepID=A0A3N2PZ96_SODAK|nr:hypothetical protein SODALDRAFT_377769 [Sodiomyces alkalinus F11]ROT39853.1 hypothetical protein SODALDRAFT_377769 [Sodiomyces alkalinus F11]
MIAAIPVTDEQRKARKKEFIDPINEDSICQLASRHNDMKPCEVLRSSNGSYSTRYLLYVTFPDDGTQWVPMQPALCDDWAKIQSEVYPKQTHHPYPHIHGFGRDEALARNPIYNSSIPYPGLRIWIPPRYRVVYEGYQDMPRPFLLITYRCPGSTPEARIPTPTATYNRRVYHPVVGPLSSIHINDMQVEGSDRLDPPPVIHATSVDRGARIGLAEDWNLELINDVALPIADVYDKLFEEPSSEVVPRFFNTPRPGISITEAQLTPHLEATYVPWSQFHLEQTWRPYTRGDVAATAEKRAGRPRVVARLGVLSDVKELFEPSSQTRNHRLNRSVSPVSIDSLRAINFDRLQLVQSSSVLAGDVLLWSRIDNTDASIITILASSIHMSSDCSRSVTYDKKHGLVASSFRKQVYGVDVVNKNAIHLIHPPIFEHSYSFIRSFVHSFIRSFVHSFIRSFVHSFIHPRETPAGGDTVEHFPKPATRWAKSPLPPRLWTSDALMRLSYARGVTALHYFHQRRTAIQSLFGAKTGAACQPERPGLAACPSTQYVPTCTDADQ